MGKKPSATAARAFEAPGTGDAQLSPALQDYLEAIRALRAAQGGGGVRVTDIAARLGTRLPTVVRSIARLRGLGLAEQAERGPVRLTPIGSALAAQLAHRHADVLRLLGEVLGLPAELAAVDACVLEHGLSAASAQALHEFLERWDGAPLARVQLAGPQVEFAAAGAGLSAPDFDLLGSAAGSGGRA